jgi:hypothetical protein
MVRNNPLWGDCGRLNVRSSRSTIGAASISTDAESTPSFSPRAIGQRLVRHDPRERLA